MCDLDNKINSAIRILRIAEKQAAQYNEPVESLVRKSKEQIKHDKKLRRLTKDYKKRKRLRRNYLKKNGVKVRKLSLKQIRKIEKEYIDSFVPF